MANHKSALKRIRSSSRRRMQNRVYRTRTRTEFKKASEAITGGEDLDAIIEQTRMAVSQLDKAAAKGIVHKNHAARKKSKLMKRLAALQAEKAAS